MLRTLSIIWLSAFAGSVFGTVVTTVQQPSPQPSQCLEGKVKLRFVVLPDGTVNSVSIVEPSESDLLNNEAIKFISTMQYASYDPAEFQEGLESEELTISFEVDLDEYPNCAGA